jgi:hypothetical protein
MAVSPAAFAQSVDQLIDNMIAADNAGLNDIDNYMLKTNSMGMTTVDYFEKSQSFELDNGDTVYIMRHVPPAEIQQRHSGGNAMSDASPAELEQAADQIRRAGEQMETGMDQEMQKAGIPSGVGDMVMTPPPDQPWLSANPRDMTGMYAMMLDAAAEGKRAEAAARDPAANQARIREGIAQMKSRSRIAGSETVNGRPATVLIADNLNYVQSSPDGQFTVKSARIWVDKTEYVPLRFVIDGVMSQDGQSRDVTIEREDSNYQRAPGCGALYEPFNSVMRLSGMITPQEQAELQANRAELEEFQKQLDEMPAAQREMFMKQMGPRMQMFDSMASSGAMEIQTSIAELKCNTGLPDPVEIAQATFGGASFGAGMADGTMNQLPETRVAEPVTSAATSADGEVTDPALQTARQRCIEEKMAAAQAAQKKKRGFGKLLGAVSNVAGRLGNFEVSEAVNDAYTANATADDLASAARDLGLTEDEISECENPQ